jgi:regulatory protein
MPAPKPSLKARALRYLSNREHSRLELARKLARHASEDDNVERVLDELEAAKFLSDERFSEALVHRRAARFGNARILSELQSHGLRGPGLDQLKAGLKSDEETRALEVLRRKYASPAGDMETRAKQMRFLMQRGFGQDAIRRAIKRFESPDPDNTD